LWFADWCGGRAPLSRGALVLDVEIRRKMNHLIGRLYLVAFLDGVGMPPECGEFAGTSAAQVLTEMLKTGELWKDEDGFLGVTTLGRRVARLAEEQLRNADHVSVSEALI
jgi:hypothetical protein